MGNMRDVAHKPPEILRPQDTQQLDSDEITICWGVYNDADAGLHCERLTMRIMRSEFY